MDNFKRTSVGEQVLLIFGLICAILLALGLFLFLSLQTIERHNEAIRTQILSEWTLSNDLSRNLRLEQLEIYRQIQSNDPDEIKQHDLAISELKNTTAKRWEAYGKLVDNKTESELYSRAQEARKNFWMQTDAVLLLGRSNQDTEAKDLAFTKQAPAYEEYQKAIIAIADWTEKEGAQMAAESTDVIVRTKKIGDILIGIAVLITIGTGFLLAKVTRRLKADNQLLQNEVGERKKTETTLYLSNERFRQMSENITDVFWMTSADMQKVEYVSPAYELVWGRTSESLYAHPEQWSDALADQDRERVLTAFSTFGSDETPTLSIEFQIVRPNGEKRWVHCRGFRIRNNVGEVIGLTGATTDITERKLAEEQIKRLRDEHQSVLNSVGEGVHWIDLDGMIKYENPVAAKMLGYEVADLVGKPAHTTMHHTHMDGTAYPVTDCPIYATLRDGNTRRVTDELFWRKNGTSFPVEYTSTPVRDDRGDLDGAVVVFTDVTERRRIEARLLQSQKMETVGKLAGGVAHEFNSILTAIIGQSELLLSDLPAGSPFAKNASEISNAAERAATLTRQLLAYGRKQILQPEILDLNLVLQDMTGTVQHLMGREVEVRINPGSGLKMVKIDPGQMEQVIVNMAMNAASAMPNGGKLIMETANVILDEQFVVPFPGLKPGGYVMLAITDTGLGMSEEVKGRVFDPFFSTKGIGEGTGLGLATCYGILKQSEGHINVYSEIARGTTFKIYLPQVEVQVKPLRPRLNPSDLPQGTETILLAEDDPSLREMSAMLLRRLGYTVWTATNGVEALSLKQQRDIGHIDLLFTDVVMPHMSGKELSDRIRAIYPQTKILFTSAYTESAIVHQGILTEGVTLLSKPFTPSALAHKIREMLDRPMIAKE